MSDQKVGTRRDGWNHARAGCDLGEVTIDRVVDMERLSYAHAMLLPTADAGELRRLSGEMGPRLIDPETLVTTVSAIVRRNPEIQVLVGGDQAVDYGHIYGAMVLLQKAGVAKVGLMSDPLESIEGG